MLYAYIFVICTPRRRVMRLTRGVKILIRMRKVILLSRNRYTKDGPPSPVPSAEITPQKG